MVKMLRDVPQFIGTDGKNYMLKQDEEALVPDAIANVLCERKLADLIEEGAYHLTNNSQRRSY